MIYSDGKEQVEAIRLTTNAIGVVVNWLNTDASTVVDGHNYETGEDFLHFKDESGTAKTGDWIVRTSDGGWLIVPDSDFSEKYTGI